MLCELERGEVGESEGFHGDGDVKRERVWRGAGGIRIFFGGERW